MIRLAQLIGSRLRAIFSWRAHPGGAGAAKMLSRRQFIGGLIAALSYATGAAREVSASNHPDPVMHAGIASGYTPPDYFQHLCALLEPDALEPIQRDTFTYTIGDSETKWIVASYYTRIGLSGDMEIRDPRAALSLRGVTLQGRGANAGAIILDPTIPTYADAFTRYYARLNAIAELPTKHLALTSANQTLPFLPGAYGAIILNATNYDCTWIIFLMAGAGINLANESGDTGSTDYQRNTNRLCMPVNKFVVNELMLGNTTGGKTPLGSLIYVLLPSTWSAVPDPLAPYAFRDDFMGASIDTSTGWTRAQSTAGNLEINPDYQWCKVKGNGNWGDNGMFSQGSISRAAGKVFLCDIYPGRSGVPNAILGFHDGAGHSYTDLAHGVDFSISAAAKSIFVFENGTSRGVVGGWTAGSTYRIRITLGSCNDATYEIQGAPEYAPIGGSAWSDITPGTTSSSTTPLYAGVAIHSAVTDCYISDVRIKG